MPCFLPFLAVAHHVLTRGGGGVSWGGIRLTSTDPLDALTSSPDPTPLVKCIAQHPDSEPVLCCHILPSALPHPDKQSKAEMKQAKAREGKSGIESG